MGRAYSRTNFNPRQRVLQTVVRSLIIITLALAVARPVISLASSQESVVFAVDVSASVSSKAIADAARRIDEITAALAPAYSKIVVFGADAAVLDGTEALRALAGRDVRPDQRDVVDRTGSDLERGLDAARAELRPGAVPRVVLFSDGRSTAGEVRAAVERLAAAGVPVSVEPMATRDIGDTWVDAITVPARVAPGALAATAVVVGSQRAASALVELRDGTKVLGSKVVPVVVGQTAVSFDVTFDRPGARVLEASVRGSRRSARRQQHAAARGRRRTARACAVRRRHAGQRAVPGRRADGVRLRRHGRAARRRCRSTATPSSRRTPSF